MITEMPDVGLTRNSDLVEAGIDEFAPPTKPKSSAKTPEKEPEKPKSSAKSE